MSMMPNLPFEVKPILVWKQYAKGHDFSGHYLPDGVQVTPSFRKLCYSNRMPSFTSIPNSIEANAQAWFSSSFIHDSKLIIEVLSKQAKKNHPTGQIARFSQSDLPLFRSRVTTDSQAFGNNLEGGRQPTCQFAVNLQSNLYSSITGTHYNLLGQDVAYFGHGQMRTEINSGGAGNNF